MYGICISLQDYQLKERLSTDHNSKLDRSQLLAQHMDLNVLSQQEILIY